MQGWFRWIWATIYLAYTIQSATAKEPLAANENAVKASYFARFVKILSYGKVSDPSANVCLVNGNPFGRDVKEIEAVLTSPEKTFQWRSIPKSALLDSSCGAVYFSTKYYDRVPVSDVAQVKAITVGDIPSFAHDGGMIELVKIGNTIKFNINLKAMDQKGYQLDPTIVGLANRVYYTIGEE